MTTNRQLESSEIQSVGADSAQPQPIGGLNRDAHVVILNNYIRPHHVASYRELAKRVKKLTVLLSVPMEPDRHWQPEWEDLDVRVQKNWMFTLHWRHSSGFAEPNYIHVPVDTTSQLKGLKPDIVFSYEMGMRTLLSCWYRRFHSDVPLVMVGNMTEHVENERGFARRLLRRAILRGVDYFTYNGPSCQRYLDSLSIPADKQFLLPYCFNFSVVYHGQHQPKATDDRRLLYCGALSERKGIVPFADALANWCRSNPERRITLAVAGDGPLREALAASAKAAFTIDHLGQCDADDLIAAYAEADMVVFPSLADEWGMVPVEAMASGLPVLGSFFAQSIEDICQEDQNGWSFDPTNERDLSAAIGRALACSSPQLVAMGEYARKTVAHITPNRTADHFCQIIEATLPQQDARK